VAGSSFTDNLRQFANEIGLQSFSGAAAAPTITISPVHVDKIYSEPSETSNDSDAILTTNAISGITVAVVLIIILVVCFCFYCRVHKLKATESLPISLSTNTESNIPSRERNDDYDRNYPSNSDRDTFGAPLSPHEMNKTHMQLSPSAPSDGVEMTNFGTIVRASNVFVVGDKDALPVAIAIAYPTTI